MAWKNINHILGGKYHPQSQWAVESFSKTIQRFLNEVYTQNFVYVGYFDVFSSSHVSLPTLSPSPQSVDPDWDRFGPDPGEPSSKSNYSSSPKYGKRKQHQFFELQHSRSRLDRLRWQMK